MQAANKAPYLEMSRLGALAKLATSGNHIKRPKAASPSATTEKGQFLSKAHKKTKPQGHQPRDFNLRPNPKSSGLRHATSRLGSSRVSRAEGRMPEPVSRVHDARVARRSPEQLSLLLPPRASRDTSCEVRLGYCEARERTSRIPL